MDIKLIQEKAYKLMGSRKAHIEREKGGIYFHGQRCANIAIKLRKQILPNATFMTAQKELNHTQNMEL